MVREVRGMGLMNGIVFEPPRQMSLRLSFEMFKAIHPGMFGQLLARRLFHEHRILSQVCGNNFMVLKVAPPLVVTEAQIGIMSTPLLPSLKSFILLQLFGPMHWSLGGEPFVYS